MLIKLKFRVIITLKIGNRGSNRNLKLTSSKNSNTSHNWASEEIKNNISIYRIITTIWNKIDKKIEMEGKDYLELEIYKQNLNSKQIFLQELQGSENQASWRIENKELAYKKQ